MRGKKYYAVTYSEYGGDFELDESDRCLIDKVHKEGLKNWNVSTAAERGTEAKLDMDSVKKCWKILENKNKGEKNLLKIVIKNKETGIQSCVDIPKEKEDNETIKALKVGMTVYCLNKRALSYELVEIIKIVDDRPRSNMGGFKKVKEENEARKEYREKPYFNVRLDTMKGTSDGKENLEKIKFPCWVTFRYHQSDTDHIGMLVSGLPHTEIQYQLIDMERQVDVKNVCTVWRNTNLKELMDKGYIHVIKGESQLWKIGKFNV